MASSPQTVRPGLPASNVARRFKGPIVAIVIGAILAFLLIRFWPSGDPGLQRERVVQEISVIPPPPPVPPEPEEQIMEEEPEIIEPDEEPQISEDPVEQPSDQPNDAPSQQPSSEAGGLDRAADAGSDSFRLAAGRGNGMFGPGGGGGGGGVSWGRYVEGHIERALQRDSRTRAARGTLSVSVNIDPGGRFVGATLRSSTGEPRLDAAIRDVLQSLPALGRRRPADQEGLTHATINLRRTDG